MRLLTRLKWLLLPMEPYRAEWITVEKGLWAERAAALRLWRDGYRIVEHRWRFERTDIDLIAANEEHLLIVEVKLRAPGSMDPWADLTAPPRIARLAAAVGDYLAKSGQQRVRLRSRGMLVTPDPARPRKPAIESYWDYLNPEAVPGWRGPIAPEVPPESG